MLTDWAKDYVIRPSSEENELVVICARDGQLRRTRVQLDIEAFPRNCAWTTGRYHW